MEEMNASLEDEVFFGEVQETLESMQTHKIHSPNGLPIEFYTNIFSLLKNDLVLVVNESRTLGNVIGSLNSTFLDLIPEK